MRFSVRQTCSLITGAVIMLIVILLAKNSSWVNKFETSLEIVFVHDGVNAIEPKDEVVTSKYYKEITLADDSQTMEGKSKSSAKPLDQVKIISDKTNERMAVCVVCCGEERINETLTALKSVVIFSSSLLKIIVFTDLLYFDVFINMHQSWPFLVQQRVQVSVQEASYPASVGDEWRGMFRTCASLRLFLPSLLPHTSSLLYLDTDAVLVSPLEHVWRHLYSMNSSQLAGVTTEHQDSAQGWYNRFARHPYYGKLGINSGVMLMNLSRMRSFNWVDYMVPLKEQYESTLRWGDQDLLNILFHFHPEVVYLMDCSYNYRPDHCMYGQVCSAAAARGVRVLHASRRAAHTNKFPPFRDVYAAINQFVIGRDSVQHDLYDRLFKQLSHGQGGRCSLGAAVYLRQMAAFVTHQQMSPA